MTNDRESKMEAYIKATEFMRGPELEGDMLTIAYMDGYAKGVEAEREGCAQIAEKRFLVDGTEDMRVGYDHARKVIAAAIRARGTNEA